MLKDKINIWLSGTQNFTVGKILFSQLSDDQTIIGQLNKGHSPKTHKLLVDSLTALLKPPAKNHQEDPQMPPDRDKVLTAIRDKWTPIYKQMCYLTAKLDAFGNSNDDQAITSREVIALQILELEQQCIECWNERDYYIANGKLPERETQTPTLPVDPVEAAKTIENIKRNIRRNKKLLLKNPTSSLYINLYNKYCSTFKTLTGNEYHEKNTI